MKKVIYVLIVFAVGSGLFIDANAGLEEKLSVKARIWHRFEASDRDFDSGTALNNFNFLRTQLGIGIQADENISAFIQLQDSRVMGSEFNTLLDGSADNFDLFQGYLNVEKLFWDPLKMKLGRMVINYGEQRLIGEVGWHYIGRSFDGVKFNVHGDKFGLDVFNLVEIEKHNPGDYRDQFVYGGHLDLKLKENHTTQVFVFVQRRQPSRELNRITLGAHLKGDFGGFSYESDLAYQFGDITTVVNIDDTTEVFTGESVSAYMATLKLGYTAKDVKTSPAIFGAVDYLSGDKDPTDTDYQVFNTLYATNHKFYGFMDYFIVLPRDTYGGGLVDLWGRLKAIPLKKTTMMLDTHYFQSAEDVALPDDATSKKFGTEVDFTIRHEYADNLNFLLGASWFKPGEIFWEKKKNPETGKLAKDNSTWFYVMTVFNI
jgi:hypothetical protein